MSLPTGIEKLPKGIKIRGDRIQLFFVLEGQRCRELLPKNVIVSKNSIKYAHNKLQAIRAEIAESRFNYREHFPESINALKIEGASATDLNRTVFDGVDMWLEITKEAVTPSTYSGYKSKADAVKDYFGTKRIRSIRKLDVIRFRKHLLEVSEYEIKTITDIFTPLRQTLLLAKQDGIIKENIMEIIPNLKPDDDKQSDADPFTEKEMKRSMKLKTDGYYRPQALNLFIFTCWTGLSFSEAMAVAWEDIDLKEMTLRVQRARVEGEFKVPKEVCRTRTIDLLQPAIDILNEQRAFTYLLPPKTFEVRRRNNRKTETQEIKLCFFNTMAESEDNIWRRKAVQDAYKIILRKAVIRHRGANQCRHTFASTLITKHVPIDMISAVLGHSSTETTRKFYAKIIPQDRPNTARLISNIMGIEYAHGRVEAHKNA
jgi:integrase